MTTETPQQVAARADLILETFKKRGRSPLDVEQLNTDIHDLVNRYDAIVKEFADYRRQTEMRQAVREDPRLRVLLVKPWRDRDCYVGWSMACDAPTGSWTRQEALDYGFFPEWLDAADAHGSNSHSGHGVWDDSGFVVEGRAWLRRDRIGDYMEALLGGRTAKAEALLEPCDDDEEVTSPGEQEANLQGA